LGAYFLHNAVVAGALGIRIGTVDGMHLPYVSHPEALVQYIVERTRRFLKEEEE
jgi:hypothetical protein